MRIPMLCAALVVAGAAAVGPANADPAQLQAGAQNSNGCYIPERVAHRLGGGEGAQPYYWENSWKAYERSLAAGVKIFETDVRWTSDGVPILMHDPTLDRTTTGTGNVSDHPISYIDSIELKNGGGAIPHFEDFLKRAKADNVQVWPEYKPEAFNQAWIDDYARLITEVGADTVVPSFKEAELEQFKQKLPNNKQIWFHNILKGQVKPSDVPAGAYVGLINAELTFGDVMKQMNKAGIGVYAWYNEVLPDENPEGWAEVARFKPLGLITDYPEAYQQWGAATTYCAKPKAKCAKLPKKLKAESTVVLLKRTCKTSAGTKVKVSLTGKKSAAKLKKGKNGKVWVVTGKKGKVTVAFHAEGSAKAGPLDKSKKYTLK